MRPFIKTETYKDRIRMVVEGYGPRRLDLLFVTDIPQWCAQYGKPHNSSPFTLARAFADGDSWLIVFKHSIWKKNLDEQSYEGVEHAQDKRTATSTAFILHLVLHETYNDPDDKKANIWALNEMQHFILSFPQES